MKGLIIDIPHIDNILSGRKVWEMRSKSTRERGAVALIQKGSLSIVGVAELEDSLGPLSREEMLANHAKHLISPERLDLPEAAKYRNAWVMQNARRLPKPLPYHHRPGQVIWVSLDADVESAVRAAAGL